mmetsp:Transcript_28707/g.55268  ORF Transcript_28707/g.55268 Transcript_28707/m.55268 type:complete len:371 (+) Transcript_28707:72-1184(+)
MVQNRWRGFSGTLVNANPINGCFEVDYGSMCALCKSSSIGRAQTIHVAEASLVGGALIDWVALQCLKRWFFERRTRHIRHTRPWIHSLLQQHKSQWMQFADVFWKGCVMLVAIAALLRSRAAQRCCRKKKESPETTPQEMLPWCCKQCAEHLGGMITDDSSDGSTCCNDDRDDLWKQSYADKCHNCSNPVVLGMLLKIDQAAGGEQQLMHWRRQPQITNLLLPEWVESGRTNSTSSHQLQHQQQQQQQQLPLLESEDTDVFSFVDEHLIPFGRRWTEPTTAPGFRGFVRQRTKELNSMESPPVFPWVTVQPRQHAAIEQGGGTQTGIIRISTQKQIGATPGFVQQTKLDLENIEQSQREPRRVRFLPRTC